jgi:hypothetical protein
MIADGIETCALPETEMKGILSGQVQKIAMGVE